ARTRGATFGARLVEIAATQGLRARVGIADDRFTAWVAASSADAEVVSVPRGGSAVFLAPRPISLLAIPVEVQHVLAMVGVRPPPVFALTPPDTATALAPREPHRRTRRGKDRPRPAVQGALKLA